MRIAIVGSGISGIAAAHVLKKSGHEVVVFERSGAIGGVWALAYPQVRLQNIAEHYRLSDFPWPFPPDLHPSGEQIRRYLSAAVQHFALEVHLNHEVKTLHEEPDGWRVDVQTPEGSRSERFDFVVVAVGHYSQEKPKVALEGSETFKGAVLTERSLQDLDVLSNKRVAVVGFGKSALDIAAFAAERGSQVHHVFREARWLLPKYLFGIHTSKIVFARMSTAMLPSWSHPNRFEATLHERLPFMVSGFWKMVTMLVRGETGLHQLWRDPAVRERMRLLEPTNALTYEMRSAMALAPDGYFKAVMKGGILPYRTGVKGLSEDALLLADGRTIPCDLAVLAVGHKSPEFPFLPERYRDMLTSETDGSQLYRHLLHPHIPRLAFAGFNHGFLHVPGVEVAMLWLSAHLRGDLRLPSADEMARSISRVRAWKRENTLFEPSRLFGIATRFHQHLDVLLGDLGVTPYRKKSGLAEIFGGYVAEDYRNVFEEYERARADHAGPRTPLPLDG